jgi:hypothetical protein
MSDRRLLVATGSVVILLGVMSAIGVSAYNAGVAYGIASSGQLAVEQGGRAVQPPWGSGFVWFPFPLLLLFSFLFLLRGFFWGGPWRARYRYDHGVPPFFDEWHRRVHAYDRNPVTEPTGRTTRPQQGDEANPGR